ncbi:MAG: sigma 54-dependent Fis family transcriptional regulator [Myxococcaceae bacterium]|nr:sigma 54-dependent Fis family transcriptional regulator [Myxococcaceae bacterium]
MVQTRLSTQWDERGAPLRCQLVVVEGPEAGRAVTLDGPVTVGTSARCALRLSDERVSGEHLEVAPAGGRFSVRDLDSTNGTFFEGSRVTALEVSAGATFKLGRSVVRVEPQPRPLEVRPSAARRFGELVGESLAMRELFAVLELAAPSDATVLVTGETGTGKELVARALHDASPRRKGPFVAVDCGALPESLLDSELFGHVKGAFTGAQADRRGAFMRADGGTLFLDELGRVSVAVQAKLLRALEERRVKPVGADVERAVDVRVVAATPMDLSAAIAAGAFRADLYYRLSVLALELPPLRSRREDLPLLVAELLRRRGIDPGPVEGPALDRLKSHRWPGNVRELRNVIDRALVLSPGARAFGELKIALERAVGPGDAPGVRNELPYKDAKDAVLEVFERTYLRELMARHRDNLSAAARDAGVDRKHWRALLKKHGLFGGPEEDA